MKKIVTIIGILIATVASAQWSNTNNMFEDSLHMPVSSALLVQKNVIVLNSYPDNGFIVIWEDERNTATTKTDIYAQKYDASGKRLWADNGVPVSNGPNNQHYTFSSSQDYRNRSLAATDSAGGFYLCYADDSLAGSERIRVQHIQNNGTTIFPNQGFIVSYAVNTSTQPQLIADGMKGFFVSWIGTGNSTYYITVRCYRDENGSMRSYGGAVVNYNSIQTNSVAACGIKTTVQTVATSISDYNIWSDGQAGCNVIMNMNGNSGTQGSILAYNRVWRAKKNSQSTVYYRSATGVATSKTDTYVKDSVYLLYTLVTDFQDVACGSSPNAYAYTNYRLLSNGYKVIDIGAADYFGFSKGVTVSTTGNINADIIASTRKLTSQGALDFTVQGYVNLAEKFDSVPYQRSSFSNPDIGYNPIIPVSFNKLTFFRDTLLAASNAFPDFSLAADANNIYIASLMSNGNDSRRVRLQHLEINKIGDSFAVQYKTGIGKPIQRSGAAIGSELNTSNYINYDLPFVIAKKGTALLYIREEGRSARISPIRNDVELSWGAMGVPLGTGVYKNAFYHIEKPFVALDSNGVNGLIAWKDDRSIPGTSDNIFMRHLDKLNLPNYSPPHKRLKLLPNPFGPSFTSPAIMYGTSKAYSRLEVVDGSLKDSSSHILDIYDDNYLGSVQASLFQQSGAIRRYNNDAYLNRNYAIKTDSIPPGANINLYLYFTKQEFDALKSTDNTIINPAYLTVIRQPGTSASAPATYTPVAGEESLTINTWDSLTAGGYAIQVTAKGFGYFFVKKIGPLSLCSGAVTTSIPAGKTSNSYSWQVNTGSGFTLLSNNVNYSGTQTATLVISNIPSSFNGNLYRCTFGDLTVSKIYLLEVANIWTGAVNNQWETAGNWSCNKVPDAATDVVINKGPVTINSATAICRSIKLSPGISFTVLSGFKLTVTH